MCIGDYAYIDAHIPLTKVRFARLVAQISMKEGLHEEAQIIYGNALQPNSYSRSRIQIVAQRVADEVEGEYAAHHRQGRENDQVR